MSHRETADDYDHVVVVLDERWRVIDSAEPYPYRQWILQQRTGNSPINGWKGRSFLQTREALLRTVREKVGRDTPETVLAPLRHLPDRDMGQKPVKPTAPQGQA
jgi:hypothetical protein